MSISSANLCIRFHLQKYAALVPPKHTHTHTHTHIPITITQLELCYSVQSGQMLRNVPLLVRNQERQYSVSVTGLLQSLPFAVCLDPPNHTSFLLIPFTRMFLHF